MPKFVWWIGYILPSCYALALGAPASEFTHFEARHCHPIDHTPDGELLLAVNSPEARLSIFSTTVGRHLPLLIAEIPVGLEPVSVRVRSNQEAWVINEVSDSISVIDLVGKKVVASFAVGDEPADVLFADGKAFVSCARENRIAVIDPVTHARLASIPLQGISPRSLSLSADSTKLFAGFLLSGNKTTALHFRKAPAQPAPTDVSLPTAPQVALIVPDSDPRIPYDVIDHDVVEIDTHTYEVQNYHAGIGTNIHAVSCAPDGKVWAAATEARNLIRFEPNLNGVFQESRIAQISEGIVSLHDLNPHATTARIDDEKKSLSLAQPMALLADAEGAWLTAFGTDRLARVSPSGEVTKRIDLRPTANSMVRGPRGLVIHPITGRITVFNKLSHTLSVVDPAGSVLGEVALASHQPIPYTSLRGRGFFYDSRLSGNGTVSCGACHFDADIDGVAWDLGDPAGLMTTVTGYGIAIGEPEPIDRVMHPMKGPMVTQSLRGIKNAGPFHWRGDKAKIHEFNSSFSQLQAGQQLPSANMDQLVSYIESLRNHPNPHRLADNSLPATLAGGNPSQGKMRFEQANVCSRCHEGERGTNHILDDFNSVLTRQPVKTSTLEHVYKKIFFTPEQPSSLSGYGFTHDGTGHDIPRGHEYDMDRFHRFPNAEEDVMAFILCTDTGTKPAVGHFSHLPSSMLETQAAAGACDLIAHAVINGETRHLIYNSQSNRYISDRNSDAPYTSVQLAALSSSLQFFAVPPGNGLLLSIDRDGDGLLNRDTPPPSLFIDDFLQPYFLPLEPDWFIQASDNLQRWTPETTPSPVAQSRFFRLQRTW